MRQILNFIVSWKQLISKYGGWVCEENLIVPLNELNSSRSYVSLSITGIKIILWVVVYFSYVDEIPILCVRN